MRNQSFQVAGPRLFNCLPKYLRNTKNCSIEEFKEKLDAFLTRVPDEPKVNFEQEGTSAKTIFFFIKKMFFSR